MGRREMMQVPEVVEVEEGALKQGVVVELHILLFVLWLWLCLLSCLCCTGM